MDEKLTANQYVAEVICRWPETIPVFIRHRMGCVGCAMSGFETVQEVAGTYQLELEPFLAELRAAIPSDRQPTGTPGGTGGRYPQAPGRSAYLCSNKG